MLEVLSVELLVSEGTSTFFDPPPTNMMSQLRTLNQHVQQHPRDVHAKSHARCLDFCLDCYLLEEKNKPTPAQPTSKKTTTSGDEPVDGLRHPASTTLR